jgi:hypothetical protein
LRETIRFGFGKSEPAPAGHPAASATTPAANAARVAAVLVLLLERVLKLPVLLHRSSAPLPRRG